MKLPKMKGKSFRRPKKQPAAAASPPDDDAPADQAASGEVPPIEPASDNDETATETTPAAPETTSAATETLPASTETTPAAPDSEGPSEPRQGAPQSASTSADPPVTESSGRPLRLGPFNFDAPNAPRFPALFREADDLLRLTCLVYPLAELRDLARNGVLAHPARSMPVLDLPLPVAEARAIVAGEEELLREVLDDGKHAAALSALESLLSAAREEGPEGREAGDAGQAKRGEGSAFESWLSRWDGCLDSGFAFDEVFCGGNPTAVDPVSAPPRQAELISITTVEDLRNEEELVFAVELNPVEERITVIFRGSMTKCDFEAEAKVALRRIPGPDAASTVGVHTGFYESLFGQVGGAPSKYVEIMQHVERLQADDPDRSGYKLYATGHGSGGALAVLFGFNAAATVPVSVVSVGAPRVGDRAFARAFAELESRGRLRHLRLANHGDPVALAPTVAAPRALAVSGKALSPLGCLKLTVPGSNERGKEDVYYHTGMQLKLFKRVPAGESQRYAVTYSGHAVISEAALIAVDEGEKVEIEQSNKRKKKNLSAEFVAHWGASYMDRLASVEPELKKKTLNGLYRDLN